MMYDTFTASDDPTSFAHTSARERWPTIITQGIDDVHRSTHSAKEDETISEGKWILTPIPDDGESDVEAYNKELAARGSPKWHHVPWMYAECYLYRYAFVMHSSRPAVLELAARYRDIVTELEAKHTVKGPETQQQLEEADKVLFTEMSEICLWGNATDLSLLTNLSYEDIQKLQGSQARKDSENNILVNDLDKAFRVLTTAQEQGKKERRVDIVLDNAGFEMFIDLILAGYLIAFSLATTAVLHPKSIPWFVYDVLPADFVALLSALAAPDHFYGDDKPLSDTESSNLQFLDFWTAGGSYWRLPKQEPDLCEDLKDTELVIFKGDLNYRKLTADAAWTPTGPFVKAIGQMGPKSGIRVLALRTCKADVLVGLPEGEDERTRKLTGDEGEARKWAWSGKWAVVQFTDGKA
ncbi:DUF89-domain-containing protein [Clathrospora elynae]|uniref:Sugar phosphate phosphatase n=1 Tax=Clathrospora elynae TaxID=706981 RepID=A0A6A5S5G4_9PLEO|nr:DUF89-domain-containing protein [Clathrospora elynae]